MDRIITWQTLGLSSSEFINLTIAVFFLILLIFPGWVNDTSIQPFTDGLLSRTFAVQASAFFALSCAAIIDPLLDLCCAISTEKSPYWLGRILIAIGFFSFSVSNILLPAIPEYLGIQNNLPCIFLSSLDVMKILSSSGFMIVLHKLDPQLFSLPTTTAINIVTSCLAVARPYSLGRVTPWITALLSFQQMYHIAFLCLLCYWLSVLLKSTNSQTLMNEMSSKLFYLFVLTINSASPVVTYFYIYFKHETLVLNMATFTSSHITSFYFVIILSALFLVLVPGRIHRLESIVSMKQIMETKTAFVRFISHELRTPLSIISIGIELLLRQIPNTKSTSIETDRHQTLIEISSACDAALTILNELLIFDKITSGVTCLNKTCVNVSDFLNEALRMFQVQVREKRLNFVVTNSNELTLVNENGTATHCSSTTQIFNDDIIEIDKNQMTQVLRNFVSNAIKFTPHGGQIKVDVKFHLKGSSGNGTSLDTEGKNVEVLSEFFVVTIMDNGAGMSIEDQKKLFNGVVQFKPEVLQNGGGSGLGMMISKRILDMHGGVVEVMSPGEGLGTTFTLRIPVIRDSISGENFKTPVRFQPFESWFHGRSTYQSVSHGTDCESSLSVADVDSPSVEAEVVQVVSDMTRSNASFARGGTKILVVDDSKLNRTMVCRLLKSRGYECSEATDGLEAINAIRFAQLNDNIIDAILMDYIMPNMDGPTATSEIRKLGYCGPIIGATGNVLQSDIDYFREKGANKVLLKPLQSKQVFDTLQELSIPINTDANE